MHFDWVPPGHNKPSRRLMHGLGTEPRGGVPSPSYLASGARSCDDRSPAWRQQRELGATPLPPMTEKKTHVRKRDANRARAQGSLQPGGEQGRPKPRSLTAARAVLLAPMYGARRLPSLQPQRRPTLYLCVCTRYLWTAFRRVIPGEADWQTGGCLQKSHALAAWHLPPPPLFPLPPSLISATYTMTAVIQTGSVNQHPLAPFLRDTHGWAYMYIIRRKHPCTTRMM